MKSNFKLLVILILILMYPFQIVFAQFTNPLLPDQSFSAGTVYGRNTGCDILEYGGDVYRVSVWEPNGTTQAIGWVVTQGATQYTGTLPFTATGAIGDPDVCLLVHPDNLTIYAAVVYYDITNSEWDLEFYEWDAPSAQFISSSIFYQLATGSFGTAINIDENKSAGSEFTIVWDDVNGDIHTTVGDMGSLVIYNDLTLTSGTHPDVSMYYDGNSDVVHLAFIDPAGDLTILDYDFADLAVGNSTLPTTILSQGPQNSGVYTYPRIACPRSYSASAADWTVVVEETDVSINFYYIVGYNNAPGNTQIIYNDGNSLTPSPADLTAVPNYYVSVCYDDNYPSDGIWVGWQFDDIGGNYSGYSNIIKESAYSIVLKCDFEAVPIAMPNYLQVPTSVTSFNNDYSGFLSLGGRNGTNELFLTYQNVTINGSNVDDVNFKTITGASGISALRNNVSMNGEISSFDQFNDDEFLEMKILGMEGKLLFNKQVLKQDIQNRLAEFSRHFSSTIYLVSLHSIETGKSFNYKLLLGQ